MTTSSTAIAILAGGRGSRLWPLSRPEMPKQFVPILPDGSLLQATFNRASRIVSADAIIVVGSREHAHIYHEQLPELSSDNLILEPLGRGTAPCIGLTAATELIRARFDVIVTVPVDHVIPDADDWISAVKSAAEFASASGRMVSIAAIPDEPQVKFGYIQTGESIGGNASNPIYSVVRFVEKPSHSELESLLASGACLRNMGMLAFEPSAFLDALARSAPGIRHLIDSLVEADFSVEALDECYGAMPKASVDRTVLQEAEDLAVVAARIESIDAGDFASIGQALEKDSEGNATRGRTVAIDAASNTVISEDATVALVGVNDLVVVVDGDTVLVCPKRETQRIGLIADRPEAQNQRQ